MADDGQKYFFLNMLPLVNGGSTKTNHVGWLELTNWDFSMDQKGDVNTKTGGISKAGSTGRFGFSIMHNGPTLFFLCASGQYIDTPIVFEAERAGVIGTGSSTGTSGASSTVVYFQLTFTRTVVSHRHLQGDDGQKIEHIDLVFQNVKMVYKQIVNGVLGSAIPKQYDAKSNMVS